MTQFYNVEVTTRRRSTTSTAARRTTARSADLAHAQRRRHPEQRLVRDHGRRRLRRPRRSRTIRTSSTASRSTAGIVRFDRRTGERVGIKPVERQGRPPLRWNWDTPLIISPHSRTRLYLGANRLFRSDDRGNTWTPISPDLTRQTDRNMLPVMGRVWAPEAVAQHQSTATWGNISAVSESRKRKDAIAGTDDGNVQVSLDGGANWRKSEHPPGLPDYSGYGVYVQRVYAGKTSEDVAYSLFENSKNGDFKPYLYKSTNRGATWTSIAGDLPANGMVLAFAEDHVDPNLLFVGTEFGLFFTVNGGQKWIRAEEQPADHSGARSRRSRNVRTIS